MSAPTGWPEHLPTQLDIPDSTVLAVLAGSARRYQDRTALRLGDAELSFARLYRRACGIGQLLADTGISRGDVVAIHLGNGLDYPLCYFGILLSGAAAAPLSPMLTPADTTRQLADSGARAIITDAAGDPLSGDTRDGVVRLVLVDEGAPPARRIAIGTPEAADPPPVRLTGADTAHLVFSGGTTGRPKAVVISHRNLLAETLQYACWRTGAVPETDDEGGIALRPVPGDFLLRPGEATALTAAPLFHSMGLVGLSQHVASGTTLVAMSRFEPGRFLDLVEAYQVQHLLGAPSMFHAILECPTLAGRDLGSVRAIGCASAPVPVPLTQRLEAVFSSARVRQSYGLTEATLVATAPPYTESAPDRFDSCGVPLPGTEVSVRDAAGICVPDGTVGELWIRGPQVSAGYLNRPEETAATFVDGWLRTGDLGRRDRDGYLAIVGRIKDMLIYKGYNVYPGELEEIMLRHECVANAAVVGRPAEHAGEIPVGFVVLRTPCPPDDVMAFVNAQVAPVKRLRELHVVSALPLSGVGKILKTELRAMLDRIPPAVTA
ncbi:long-chain acyl-CoA synthetase [Micromonospora viridifaciens]|uniref:Long-chain acyl-CoA synthetase n=1 Tax=Micromonospora viridifaciens TaxID=1881 RepID=A0A1C4YVR4_MICVI|nr:AMP-binding protein [Micromonospora viridifaciens]SCF24833.1 long-chain acyl-CoA synthetase [Micromonospora viridifaciens]